MQPHLMKHKRDFSLRGAGTAAGGGVKRRQELKRRDLLKYIMNKIKRVVVLGLLGFLKKNKNKCTHTHTTRAGRNGGGYQHARRKRIKQKKHAEATSALSHLSFSLSQLFPCSFFGARSVAAAPPSLLLAANLNESISLYQCFINVYVCLPGKLFLPLRSLRQKKKTKG